MDATSTAGLLLDLLEVLTASSLIGGAGVCLRSQRTTMIYSSALLTTVSCSPQYFVKKRALLLLKRAVLQKAGEDWAPAGVLSTGLRYKDFHSDMNMLAHSVLTAVAAGWLHSVQVKSASYFGGTKRIRGEEGHKPDCVMLRAVSLLLLKSMELHIQTAGATGEGPHRRRCMHWVINQLMSHVKCCVYKPTKFHFTLYFVYLNCCTVCQEGLLDPLYDTIPTAEAALLIFSYVVAPSQQE